MIEIAISMLLTCSPYNSSIQTQEEDRWKLLVKQLDSDQPGERDSALKEIQTIGAPLYSFLIGQREESSEEQRRRIDALMDTPAFAAVPQIVTKNINRLSSSSAETWYAGVKGLVWADKQSLSELDRAKLAPGIAGFRAAQVRAIIADLPREKLAFGIVLDKPEVKLDEQLSGVEVFANLSKKDISIPLIDAEVEVEEANPFFSTASDSLVAKVESKVLRPNEVYIKRRSTFLSKSTGDSSWGYVITAPGNWKLVPRFIYKKDVFQLSCWTGEIKGAEVFVKVAK